MICLYSTWGICRSFIAFRMCSFVSRSNSSERKRRKNTVRFSQHLLKSQVFPCTTRWAYTSPGDGPYSFLFTTRGAYASPGGGPHNSITSPRHGDTRYLADVTARSLGRWRPPGCVAPLTLSIWGCLISSLLFCGNRCHVCVRTNGPPNIEAPYPREERRTGMRSLLHFLG